MAEDSTSKPGYILMLPWDLTPVGGVNRVVLGLSEAMRGTYVPIVVIIAWETPANSQYLWVPLPTMTLPVRNLLGFTLRLVPNMHRLWSISRQQVAINAHFPGLELLPLLLLRRLGLCPELVLSVHGSDLIDPTEATGARRALFAWMFRTADVVIACSEELAGRVRRVSPKARVRVIWNAVDQPPEIEQASPWPERKYLVCVAGFVKVKAHDVLLAAYQRILAERPELGLMLIGADGPTLPAVREQIAAMQAGDRVRVLVNVPHEEVWGWMRHAECLVLSSRQEAFGIVLLEAALVGTPVVASRLGGIAEFLEDRVHGLLCTPDSPAELAGAVLETLADTAATAQRVERFQLQAKRFRWEDTFARYQDALRSGGK